MIHTTAAVAGGKWLHTGQEEEERHTAAAAADWRLSKGREWGGASRRAIRKLLFVQIRL